MASGQATTLLNPPANFLFPMNIYFAAVAGTATKVEGTSNFVTLTVQ